MINNLNGEVVSSILINLISMRMYIMLNKSFKLSSVKRQEIIGFWRKPNGYSDQGYRED